MTKQVLTGLFRTLDSNRSHDSINSSMNDSTNPLEYYKTQEKITNPKEYIYFLDNLPTNIPELCNVVHGVISHRNSTEMYGLELTEKRKQEGETRYVSRILKRINEYDFQSPYSETSS